MKTITVKVDAYKYETADGKIFDDQETAYEWEKNVKCVALGRIADKMKLLKPNDNLWNLTFMLGFSCSDVEVKKFSPESEDDVRNFFIYINARDCNILSYCRDMEHKMKPGDNYLIFESLEYDDIAIFSDKSFVDFIEERKNIFIDLMDN